MLRVSAINVPHKPWVVDTIAQQFLNSLAVVDGDFGGYREQHTFDLTQMGRAVLRRYA